MKKRTARNKSGSGNSGKAPTCNFFNKLSFLSDTMVNKESDSNLMNSSAISSVPNAEEGSDVNIQKEICSPTSSSKISKKRKNEETSQMNLLDAAIIQTLNNVQKQTEPVKSKQVDKVKDKDSDKLFCMSLVDTLKNLTPQKNAMARIKIQQVLYEVMFENQ